MKFSPWLVGSRDWFVAAEPVELARPTTAVSFFSILDELAAGADSDPDHSAKKGQGT